MAYRDIQEGRAKSREYQKGRKATPDGRRQWCEYMREWTRGWKVAAMEILGGQCVRCGFDDPRALQFDHVNGDGQEDFTRFDDTGRRRRKTHSLGTYYKKIAENSRPGRFQLLCANCNWIKRVENEEHTSHIRKVV